MNKNFIKERSQQIRKILLAVIILLLALIAVKVFTLAVGLVRMPFLINAAIGRGGVDADKVAEYLGADKKKVESLKKRNMFMPAAPAPSPPAVTGILGKSALINGAWYKVGAEVAGAKILRIESTQIVIEWQGKEMGLAPLLTANSSAGSEPNKIGKKKKNHRRRDKKMNSEPQKNSAEAVTAGADPLAWMGVTLSPALRAKLLEKWNQMTDEQKEQFKKQWNSMGAEQKQNMMSAMEQ